MDGSEAIRAPEAPEISVIQANFSCSVTYNALADSFEADQGLTAAGRDEVLRRLSEIIVRHELHDDIGIRLLHKHNDIAASELMIEREEFDGDDYCLATVACPVPPDGERFFPHCWAMGGAEPIALEFSTDALVGEKASLLHSHPCFVDDFKRTLDALGISSLLGPCILGRTFYARHKPLDPGRDCLIEVIDETRRANVLKFRAVAGQGTLIDTVWRARDFVVPPEVTMGCKTETTTRTICAWESVIHCNQDADGRHLGTTTVTNEHRTKTEETTTHTFFPD